MRFRVGDVCVYIDTALIAAMQGAECTILEIGDFPNGEYICDFPGFKSHAPSGKWCCEGKQLRLKRPPSWDQWLTSQSHLTAEDKREDRQKERV